MNVRRLAGFILMVVPLLTVAQTDQGINNTDKSGRKQGHWIRKYPNGNIMYEGFFKDDKPEGEFKRYYEEESALKSILVFSKNGTEADATLYYPNGYVAAKGRYVNQKKSGKWQFFSAIKKGSLISEQEYSGDLKNGLSLKYYADSTLAEKMIYINDVKEGEWLRYHPNGKVSLRANFRNGKVDGLFEAYYDNGQLEFYGNYRNDLREGPWKIYNKDGSLKFEIDYVAGVPRKNDLELYQSAMIDSLEKNIVKIPDPDVTGVIW